MPCGSHKPRSGIGRNSLFRPLDESGGAGILHSVLGKFEVSNQARDGCNGSPPMGAEDGLEIDSQSGNSTSGLISTPPSFTPGSLAAHFTASSRSAHSIRR